MFVLGAGTVFLGLFLEYLAFVPIRLSFAIFANINLGSTTSQAKLTPWFHTQNNSVNLWSASAFFGQMTSLTVEILKLTRDKKWNLLSV